MVKTKEELIDFLQKETLDSKEAREYLGISREALSSLVKRGKLIPMKELSRDRLFLKSDLDQRKRESEKLRPKYRPYE